MKKLLLVLFSALLLCSCSKSMQRFDMLNKAYMENGFDAAINEVQTNKEELYGEKSMFLYYYDLGVLHHYNRNFDSSIEAFNQARQIYEDLYARSVTNEVGAMVTNDNTRPYRARPFEILLLCEFQILNQLGKGDVDAALVEVKQAQIVAEQLYQKDNEKVNDNGFLRYLTALVYEMQGDKDDASIAYYETVKAYNASSTALPKEVYGFVSDRLLDNERESDFNELGMEPAPSEVAKSTRENEELVVIAYRGRAPILKNVVYAGGFAGGEFIFAVDDETMKGLEGFRVPFPTGALNALLSPLGVTTNMIPTIFIAVPYPVGVTTVDAGNYRDIGIKSVEIELGDGEVHFPEMVYDATAELEQNIADERSADMVRTVSQTLIKAAPLVLANKKATEAAGVLGGFASRVAGDAALRALAQSDTRIGSFNPRQIAMTRIPVQAGDYQVEIRGKDNSGRVMKSYKMSVPVKKGEKKVVLVPLVY